MSLRLSRDVQAVQFLTDAPDEPDDLTASWRELVEEPARARQIAAPKLTVIRSKYRDLVEPLLEHVHRLAVLHPDRDLAIVVPQLLDRHWYEQILHAQATLLKAQLLRRGGDRIAIVNIPWQLD
jgi:hypothetical protein